MSMLLLFKLTTVKMSIYKYKGNLHNVLIHTAVHLILRNSAPYNYSQNYFISLYLYASLKNWLYNVMTSWWIMLAGCASDVKIWYSHNKIHTIRWGVPDFKNRSTTNQHYSSKSHHNIQSLCKAHTDKNPFIPLSVLWQLYSLFQSQFSIQCDLMLPLSIVSILMYP